MQSWIVGGRERKKSGKLRAEAKSGRGTVAESKQIVEGDVLLAVDGAPITDMPLKKVSWRSRPRPGGEVWISLTRQSPSRIELSHFGIEFGNGSCVQVFMLLLGPVGSSVTLTLQVSPLLLHTPGACCCRRGPGTRLAVQNAVEVNSGGNGLSNVGGARASVCVRRMQNASGSHHGGGAGAAGGAERGERCGG